MSHTPGPWQWRDGELINPDLYTRWIAAGYPQALWPFVLQGRASHTGYDEIAWENPADACVIAAAPELLAALMAARDELLLPPTSALRAQIEAAIAKAEGR